MAYDTLEAARLVSWSNKQAGIGPLTEAELTQWIDDGVGLLEWEDIWEEDGEVKKYIDFPTLISLRLICSLRAVGASFEDINELALLLRRECSLGCPFANRFFWDPFAYDEKIHKLLDDEMKGLIGLERIVRRDWMELEFDASGVAYAWFPVKGVVIDARVVSGSPCVKGTRTPTWVFTGMSKGSDSIEKLAKGYRLTEEAGSERSGLGEAA